MKSGKRRRSAHSKGKSKFLRVAKSGPPTNPVVAFAWYDAQQWARLRAIAADVEALDDRYENWLKQAEDAVAKLRDRGIHAQRIAIDVDSAAAWCAARGRPFTSSSRAEYVAEVARQLAGT